jgi:hypothetical protein
MKNRVWGRYMNDHIQSVVIYDQIIGAFDGGLGAKPAIAAIYT